MCGVAGWYAPPNSDPVALDAAMRRMMATLAHRGPDDQGYWTDARSGIACGFRRLSILDLTATGRQPMLSGEGRYACVVSELDELLPGRGVAADGRGRSGRRAPVRWNGLGDRDGAHAGAGCASGKDLQHRLP